MGCAEWRQTLLRHVKFDTDALVHCHSTRPNLIASLCVAVLSYSSVTVESGDEARMSEA